MSDCIVAPFNSSDVKRMDFHDSALPHSDLSYAEGDGIYGGSCGQWLKFRVYCKNGSTPGVIRLFVSSDDDSLFKSSLYIGVGSDERDMICNNPSCINNDFMSNTSIESVSKGFSWDVCYLTDNVYNVRYKLLLKGRFLLHVKLDGNDISGSPFNIYISDGNPSSLSTRVVNNGGLKCRCMPYIKQVVDIINDKRWSTDTSGEFLVKKKEVVNRLESCSFINELLLKICDGSGNPINIGMSYIKAWATNHGKVINIDNLSDGIVSIRYIVVVPKNKLSVLSLDYSSLPTFVKSVNEPCRIYVSLNGTNIYGSPFIPIITNLQQVEEYYKSIPDEIDQIKFKLQSLINDNEFDACLELVEKFVTTDHAQVPELLDLISKMFALRALELDTENHKISSELHKFDFIKSFGLGRLHDFIDDKYQKMLKFKTNGIINCIKELNSYNTSVDGKKKGFTNLGDVILNYRRISDELRKLHRYDLADKFDKINDMICEEIELGRWDKIILYKEQKVAQLKSHVENSIHKLNQFNDKVHSKYDNIVIKDIPKIPLSKSVQTIGEECVTSRLLPLVKSRCGQNTLDESDKIHQVVDTFWRRCTNYEIQSTISKVLKSMIRLKNAIAEIFFYYSRKYIIDNDKANAVKYGIPLKSIELFNIECKLNINLLSNKKRLLSLFEKFSTVIGNERIIMEHMWCVYIRELAYLNLLYVIVDSGELDLLRDNQHPSRLVSFHHFCQKHLLQLYEYLYTTEPEFQKSVRFPTAKISCGSVYRFHKETTQHYFPSKTELSNFISNKTPEYILNNLDIEPLKKIFKHYSRLSMYGKEHINPKSFSCNEASWISTAMFVILARDFAIIPGYLSGALIQRIADDVITHHNESESKQPGRLNFNDFVDALANVISNSIYKICMDRHKLYCNVVDVQVHQRNTQRKKFHDIRECAQSQESVYEDIDDLLNILGINDINRVTITIDAIYGSEALEYLN